GRSAGYQRRGLLREAVKRRRGAAIERNIDRRKPACRPRELIVAVPLPDAGKSPQPEITLKLDKPLTGKPALQTDVQWEGIPSAFTREPFMLTMDAVAGKVEGLKISACVAATVRRSTAK